MTPDQTIEYYRKRGASVGPSFAELMAEQTTQLMTEREADSIKAKADMILGPRKRHTQGRMNKTEAKHARDLECRKLSGEIAGYWFEEIKFRLADRTWYTPDFFVKMADGTFEVHEVKGFMEDDAAVKIKVAARLFPCFIFRLFYKGKEIVIPNE